MKQFTRVISVVHQKSHLELFVTAHSHVLTCVVPVVCQKSDLKLFAGVHMYLPEWFLWCARRVTFNCLLKYMCTYLCGSCDVPGE